MDLLEAFSKLPGLVDAHEKATARLAEVGSELAALKEDQYVTWEWVCEFFGVTKMTAVAMFRDEKVFIYGRKIRRVKSQPCCDTLSATV